MALIGNIAAAPAHAQTAIPGQAHRETLTALVRDNTHVAQLWAAVRKQADLAADSTPAPLERIVYEGRLDNDPQRVESVRHLQDMIRLDLLTQAHVVTGDARYAEKAREFVRRWIATFEPTGNPINENKLMPVLIEYARQRSVFTEAERSQFDGWVRRLAEAEIASAEKNPGTTRNNWHTKRLQLVALAGVILNEARFTQYAAEGAKRYVRESLRADGSSYDFEQRDALGYHIGGVTPLLRLAALLHTTGFDLYRYEAPGGASIRKSVAFVLPYANGERTHVEFANTKVELDRRRAAAGLEHYRPGRLFDPKDSLTLFEMAAAFEPEYAAVVARLSGAAGGKYPTWNVVLAQAGWLHDVPDL